MAGELNSTGLINGEMAFEQGLITPEQLGLLVHCGAIRAMDKSGKLYTNCHDWEFIARRQGSPLRNKISFHFDFEEYKGAKNIADDAIAGEQYVKDLSEMWFSINEINNAISGEAIARRNEEALDRLIDAHNGKEEERENGQDNIDPDRIKHRGPGRPRKTER